jgi:hypothetical protein
VNECGRPRVRVRVSEEEWGSGWVRPNRLGPLGQPNRPVGLLFIFLEKNHLKI